MTEGLGLRTYALLATPGGGHFASLEQLQPKLAKVGMQSLTFLVRRTGARRIILIGHDDCLFFREQLQFFFSGAELNQKQIGNLKQSMRVIQERFTRATVELYFVEADSSASLQFRRI